MGFKGVYITRFPDVLRRIYFTGALADTYGNYNIAFYYAGGVLILAGIMTLPVIRLSKWERSRKATLRDIAEDSIGKDTIKVACISHHLTTHL